MCIINQDCLTNAFLFNLTGFRSKGSTVLYFLIFELSTVYHQEVTQLKNRLKKNLWKLCRTFKWPAQVFVFLPRVALTTCVLRSPSALDIVLTVEWITLWSPFPTKTIVLLKKKLTWQGSWKVFLSFQCMLHWITWRSSQFLLIYCLLNRVLFSLLALAVISSTIYEAWRENYLDRPIQNQVESFPIRTFHCFSLIKNWRKLISTEDSKDSLPCLHGIRVLSIFWVVLLHVTEESFNRYTYNKLSTKEVKLLTFFSTLTFNHFSNPY